MGKKTIILLLSLAGVTLLGQNLAVRFWSQMPAGEPERRDGIPGAWPAEVVELGRGTNTPGGWTFFYPSNYAEYLRTNEPAYLGWERNRATAAEATNQVKRARLDALFEQCAAYEAFCRVSNPGPAQVAAQVREMNRALLILQRQLRDHYRPDTEQ